MESEREEEAEYEKRKWWMLRSSQRAARCINVTRCHLHKCKMLRRGNSASARREPRDSRGRPLWQKWKNNNEEEPFSLPDEGIFFRMTTSLRGLAPRKTLINADQLKKRAQPQRPPNCISSAREELVAKFLNLAGGKSAPPGIVFSAGGTRLHCRSVTLVASSLEIAGSRKLSLPDRFCPRYCCFRKWSLVKRRFAAMREREDTN